MRIKACFQPTAGDIVTVHHELGHNYYQMAYRNQPFFYQNGAKYHIPGNVPYMRYFLARVYQFQFYRAMCQAAGYKGPLNRCSVYGSKEAGAKLNAMLEMGASKPWPEALKAMTGTDKADASAIVEYFQPLMDWLKEQNKGEKEGWTLPADPLK